MRCLYAWRELCIRYAKPVLLPDLEPSVKQIVGFWNDCMSSWNRLLKTDDGVEDLACFVSERLIDGGVKDQGGVAERAGVRA